MARSCTSLDCARKRGHAPNGRKEKAKEQYSNIELAHCWSGSIRGLAPRQTGRESAALRLHLGHRQPPDNRGIITWTIIKILNAKVTPIFLYRNGSFNRPREGGSSKIFLARRPIEHMEHYYLGCRRSNIRHLCSVFGNTTASRTRHTMVRKVTDHASAHTR